MAATNLPVSSIPLFPQIGNPSVSYPLIDHCDYQFTCFPFEGESCQQLGVVHDLESEREFCVDHFREVSRGRK